MTQNLNTNQMIETKPIITDMELVTTPDLLQVKTIRKKYMEQMEKRTPGDLIIKDDTPIRVIGRVQNFVLAHTDRIQYFKISKIDFLDHAVSMLVQKRRVNDAVPNMAVVVEEANELFHKLPQIFQD